MLPRFELRHYTGLDGLALVILCVRLSVSLSVSLVEAKRININLKDAERKLPNTLPLTEIYIYGGIIVYQK